MLLQRLPGMQVHESESNSRVFIDEDLADSLRSGDVRRFIENPFEDGAFSYFAGIQTSIGELGLQLACSRLSLDAASDGSIQTAFRRALAQENAPSELAVDILRVLLMNGSTIADSFTVASKYIPIIEFGKGAKATNVTFDNCLIDALDVTEVEDASSLPWFLQCAIDRVDGVTGIDAFAGERFANCTVENFTDSAANASSILSLPISDYRRVTISILQRLFLRSGKGRKELAFIGVP